ncbi:hypothetical protein MRX96_028674 [Rhipicephalus microplus]
MRRHCSMLWRHYATTHSRGEGTPGVLFPSLPSPSHPASPRRYPFFPARASSRCVVDGVGGDSGYALPATQDTFNSSLFSQMSTLRKGACTGTPDGFREAG